MIINPDDFRATPGRMAMWKQENPDMFTLIDTAAQIAFCARVRTRLRELTDTYEKNGQQYNEFELLGRLFLAEYENVPA